jgi:Rod binding domain-containing protein
LRELEKATISGKKKGSAEQTQTAMFYQKVSDCIAKKGIGVKEMITKYIERGAKVSDQTGENR